MPLNVEKPVIHVKNISLKRLVFSVHGGAMLNKKNYILPDLTDLQEAESLFAKLHFLLTLPAAVEREDEVIGSHSFRLTVWLKVASGWTRMEKKTPDICEC